MCNCKSAVEARKRLEERRKRLEEEARLEELKKKGIKG